MNYFIRQRLPWMLCAALLVLNLGLSLSQWIACSSRHSGHLVPDNYLSEALSLDQNQSQLFETEKASHLKSVRPWLDQTNEAREMLLAIMKAGEPDLAQADRLAESIGAVQTEIEKATFRHFRGLRRHLHPEQLAIYDEIIGRVLRQGFEK